MKERISKHIEAFSRSETYSHAIKYPEAAEIHGDETIASYLDFGDGLHLSDVIRWKTQVDLPIVERRWMGILGLWPIFIPPIMAILCILVSILGAAEGFYSWWLLPLIITLIISFSVFALSKIDYEKCWASKTQTFGQLVQRIVEIKEQEWETLQRTYAVK